MQLPQARLSTQEIEFGPVRFDDIRQESLTLTNTGHAALEFRFNQEGPAVFPTWLTVAPLSARVPKGAFLFFFVYLAF